MRIGEGTVIFVTGGASGLGEETVRKMHSQGASVVVADMDVARMQALHAELQERILCVPCNVTKEAEVKSAVEQAVAVFGTIHVAVACAGVAWVTPTLTSRGPLNTKTFEAVMAINVLGSVYMAKYAAIAMSKNKGVNEQGEKGVILFVSSVAAQEAQRGQTAYGASKGAINGIVLPMARDLGKLKIRVAAIAPGIFATPMGAKMPKKIQDRLNADTPMGRPGLPAEFAHMVGFCIENGYINGVSLRIDGATRLSHL
eukprot:Macronucleus_1442.p1 GENE.Macronucleus_1442~~Macronucleus_1442.p1  ORF type:complete len:257 (+),score=67.65 Macronucleus_1442:1-771(+)